MYESEGTCDACGRDAVGPEAGTPANHPHVVVCSEACHRALLLYPCARCSAPVADEGDICDACEVAR